MPNPNPARATPIVPASPDASAPDPTKAATIVAPDTDPAPESRADRSARCATLFADAARFLSAYSPGALDGYLESIRYMGAPESTGLSLTLTRGPVSETLYFGPRGTAVPFLLGASVNGISRSALLSDLRKSADKRTIAIRRG